jgi:hypothetical protein
MRPIPSRTASKSAESEESSGSWVVVVAEPVLNVGKRLPDSSEWRCEVVENARDVGGLSERWN